MRRYSGAQRALNGGLRLQPCLDAADPVTLFSSGSVFRLFGHKRLNLHPVSPAGVQGSVGLGSRASGPYKQSDYRRPVPSSCTVYRWQICG